MSETYQVSIVCQRPDIASIILILALLTTACTVPNVSTTGTNKCTGEDNCTVCKSCRSCAHCKGGGTCGVCNGKKKPRQYREGYCEAIIDGDTIVVVQRGMDIHVRLIGVDTPETKDPRKPIQQYGKEATQFTTEMVLGKPVVLKFDSPAHPVDHFGRTLAYVHVGRVLVNKEIIRQGYGHVYVKYPFDRIMMEEFRAVEREAREHKRGLWK